MSSFKALFVLQTHVDVMFYFDMLNCLLLTSHFGILEDAQECFEGGSSGIQ